MHLRNAGMVIYIEMTEFALSRVKYLGYVVGNGTLQVDKFQAVQEFPVPQSIRHLCQFWKMTGWYRRFIQDCSMSSAHL